MKGLLLKDFYIVRAVAALMGIVFIVIGACMSYIVTPWVLTVIATVMLGMIVTSTINVDKTSGWIRNVMAMPVSRRTFISSKYILYLILSLTGLVFGTFFGFIANLLLGGNAEEAGIFICTSLTMTLLAGSIVLPFYFLMDETKSIIGMILAYPATAGIFIIFIMTLGDRPFTYGLIILLGAAAFLLSWCISVKILSQKDL